MFMAAFFRIAKKLETTQMPITNEWINQLWRVHRMEYYSTIEVNKLLIYAIQGWTQKYAKKKEADTILYTI